MAEELYRKYLKKYLPSLLSNKNYLQLLPCKKRVADPDLHSICPPYPPKKEKNKSVGAKGLLLLFKNKNLVFCSQLLTKFIDPGPGPHPGRDFSLDPDPQKYLYGSATLYRQDIQRNVVLIEQVVGLSAALITLQEKGFFVSFKIYIVKI
jgi:hypothetical protein